MTAASDAQETGTPAGIGGWLILPILWLVAVQLWACVIVGRFLVDAVPKYQGGLASVPEHIRIFMPMAFVSAIIATLLAVFAVICLVRIFQRSSRTPKLMTAFFVAAVAAPAYRFYTLFVTPRVDLSADILWTGLFMAIAMVALCAGIPYFQKSKRVKNTFVR